ncbi:CIA30 family protein [Roseivivax sp. CAU 1753]
MTQKRILTPLIAALLLTMAPAMAGEPMTEDFETSPESRWRFFTDGVMGGVSSGQVSFLTEAGTRIARMTGDVSTANNGGFIQMRMDLPAPPPGDTRGVRLVVRGNEAPYFVHLRTNGTMLPWQYYQAEFAATGDWVEVRLPFTAFKPSGNLLHATPLPTALTSIAVVAYGRDHRAQVDVREIGFY